MGATHQHSDPPLVHASAFVRPRGGPVARRRTPGQPV